MSNQDNQIPWGLRGPTDAPERANATLMTFDNQGPKLSPCNWTNEVTPSLEQQQAESDD